MTWIPVSERLPDEGGDGDDLLLVTFQNGHASACFYLGDGDWQTITGRVVSDVIAWQPLPPAYEHARVMVKRETCIDGTQSMPSTSVEDLSGTFRPADIVGVRSREVIATGPDTGHPCGTVHRLVLSEAGPTACPCGRLTRDPSGVIGYTP